MVLENEIISDLQRTGKFLMDNNLAWGTSGNISSRKDNSSFYITASGTYMGDLKKEDLIVVPNKLNQEKRPSKEFPFHKALYDNRPEINAVLHSAPFYSTLLSCTSTNIPSNYFVEAMYYLERVTRIKYHHPGSTNLAKEIGDKAETSNVFLLENHGVIVCDTSINEAIMALQTLEFTSKMFVKSLESGLTMNHLSVNVVEDFLNNSGYKKRRKWSDS